MDTSLSLPLFCENNYLAPLGSFRYHGNEGNFKNQSGDTLVMITLL